MSLVVFKRSKSLSLAVSACMVTALAVTACGGSKSTTDARATAADAKRDVASTDEGAKPKTTEEIMNGFEASVNKGKKKKKKKKPADVAEVATATGAASPHPAHVAHEARSSHDNMYVVQIGAFKVKENAEKLNEKLKSEGYPVVLQALAHSTNGHLYLVRLNPMADRHEAETMRMNLKAKSDVDSLILALPKNEREISSETASQTVGAGVHASTEASTAETHAAGGATAEAGSSSSSTEVR